MISGIGEVAASVLASDAIASGWKPEYLLRVRELSSGLPVAIRQLFSKC